ncbi:MAG: hypothetical protein M1830_003300 [Pleopsidium flavum]|nr:MAG: hypothetical protein M1830_003300 [Pleopsidium flavum]
MSDSVDRVFVHALNTVKKIPRTGSARPPPADRLKLYGLYKQSMEGDVDGVMERPSGDDNDVQAEREKWDAWNAQHGITRTEAKRRYISTLIVTMHKYASTTPDARELVSELEFVWDQIKSNPSSSSSSSPLQTLGVPPHLQQQPSYASIGGGGGGGAAQGEEQDGMRVLSPISQGDEEEMEENEQFDDARDGMYGGGDEPGRVMETKKGDEGFDYEARNRKWRRRVEQALIKMTAEVAALREQLESRSEYGGRRRRGLWAWMLWLVWVTIRHVVLDAVVLGILVVWFRRKGDRRLEQAIRMVVEMARERLERTRIPKLPRLPQR